MGHRAGFNFGPLPKGLPATAAPKPATLQPQNFRGFSYFLGPPDPQSRTTIGDDPIQARTILEALYSLLPFAQHVDNQRIPAGYTYFLQLVAHDLVETTVPFWAAAEAGVTSRNMRDTALRLDTLYGGGPTACPIAFEPAGNTADHRARLRLGLVGDAVSLGLTQGACPFRDLARLKQDTPSPPSNLGEVSQVFIADERNDDNTLLSQIVVLFSIMHNAIVDRLTDYTPQARFEHASAALLFMYHAIIRKDLMPRLLLDKVYQHLEAPPAGGPNWLWNGTGAPLEFTHGAFRVGHAMVRCNYQFNTLNKFDLSGVVGGPVPGDPVRDPLPSSWIVEWSRFFPDLGATPNYCLKLAVGQQMPLDYPGNFQPVAPNSPKHLTVRDWLSAANARMWRVDKITPQVKAKYPETTLSPSIGTWLGNLVNQPLGTKEAKKIVSDNAAILQTDLPLPLYILLESQLDPQIGGACLGPLGSVIVGETIYRRLTEQQAEMADQFAAAAAALGNDWSTIKAVQSMPQLIKLAEAWGNLKDCPQMPFIAP